MSSPPRAKKPPQLPTIGKAARAPAGRTNRDSPPSGPSAPPLGLRLAIGKDGLGLELGTPAPLGALLVTELSVTLPRVKFPVDVSGGVARFRHRRGEIARVAIELGTERLERMLRTKLRGLLAVGTPDVWVGLTQGGATLALSAGSAGTTSALAFEVIATSAGSDLRLYVTDVRGIGLPRPAVAIALQAVEHLCEGVARREGSSFVIDAVASRIARALLPDAGVRVPSADGMAVIAFASAADAWLVHLARGGVPLEPSTRAAGIAETAALLADADDALVAGDLARAREILLAVLSRAPRHAETCARIADIDRVTGDRIEAALAQLAEATGAETRTRAFLRAELLAQAGDSDVAANAFIEAAEADPASLLSARAFERASGLVKGADAAAALLDRAITRAPTLEGARFRRIERRLQLGRLDDAMADVLELEAQIKSPRARHDLWRRAAEVFLSAGLRAKAGALYERSLRYLPDDPAALAGLGRALVAQGKIGRGVRLLVRAAESFPPKDEAARDACLLELARTLATSLDDKPAALARLEAIDDRSPLADDARALEARYRTDLGDVPGAAFAWARLRNVAESIAGAANLGPRATTLAALLLEAANFELDHKGDAEAAQRHAKTSLRLSPHDADGAALFRRASTLVAQRAGMLAQPAPDDVAEAPRERRGDEGARDLGKTRESHLLNPPTFGEPGTSPRGINLSVLSPSNDADVNLELRAEDLTRKLQADPSNDAVADELTTTLLALGQSHEVFALVSARVDEATPERRPALLDKRRAIVGQLAREARAQGNEAEATLFESFANVD